MSLTPQQRTATIEAIVALRHTRSAIHDMLMKDVSLDHVMVKIVKDTVEWEKYLNKMCEDA